MLRPFYLLQKLLNSIENNEFKPLQQILQVFYFYASLSINIKYIFSFSRSITSSLFSPGVKPFKNQVYEDLKQQAQGAQALFEDPEFPADDSSLFYKGNVGQLPGEVVWKRPKV